MQPSWIYRKQNKHYNRSEDGDSSLFAEFCNNDAVYRWCQDNRQGGAARETYPHHSEAPDDWIDMYRLSLLHPPIRMECGSHSTVRAELPDFGRKALVWFAWIDLFRALDYDTSKAGGKRSPILKRRLRGDCLDLVYGLGVEKLPIFRLWLD